MLWLSISCISNVAGKTMFKETKSQPTANTTCDTITSHEGKYTYKGGSLGSACCTDTGLNDFSPKTTSFTLKTSNKTTQAQCCLTLGSRCSDSKVRCCNNENCTYRNARKICTERSKLKSSSISLELQRDTCVDKKKRFHVKVTAKTKSKSKSNTYTGDVCCDTNKIHMINYTEHCCSVSNAPFLIMRRSSSPPCCSQARTAVFNFPVFQWTGILSSQNPSELFISWRSILRGQLVRSIQRQ